MFSIREPIPDGPSSLLRLSLSIFFAVEKLDAHPPRPRYCWCGVLLMPSSSRLGLLSFSSIQAFFSARYLSLICSSLHPLCLSIVCATKFQATRRAPMAAERGFENDRVELAQVLYQPPSQVLAPLGQLL